MFCDSVFAGVNPATSFLSESQIPLAKNGFVPVDGRMQTKVPHVYAIGDIATFPLNIRGMAQYVFAFFFISKNQKTWFIVLKSNI